MKTKPIIISKLKKYSRDAQTKVKIMYLVDQIKSTLGESEWMATIYQSNHIIIRKRV
jgi:hypothetical protein